MKKGSGDTNKTGSSDLDKKKDHILGFDDWTEMVKSQENLMRYKTFCLEKKGKESFLSRIIKIKRNDELIALFYKDLAERKRLC